MDHLQSVRSRDHLTFVDVLREQADVRGDQEAFAFLADGESLHGTLTYAELDRRARALASYLQSLAPPGSHALVVLPSGLDYPVAYFGCMYAGLVVTPTGPPRPDQGAAPLEAAVQSTQATVALTTSATLGYLAGSIQASPLLQELRWVTMDAVPAGAEHDWRVPALNADDLASLWLTSGSTGLPKGTMRSHGNLLSTISGMREAMGFRPGDRSVTWLPPHFAMAVGIDLLAPVYHGMPVTIMPTAAFLERPARWLEAISRVGATHSAGPNFAYDLCVQRIPPEEHQELNLSRWRIAFSGGEMVRPGTLQAFTDAFAGAGFNAMAFTSAYGMTEAALIAMHGPADYPTARTFGQIALEHNEVQPNPSPAEPSRTLVSTGSPLAGTRCLIVNPTTLTECAGHEIGEIWFASPGIADGYWNRPEETRETFQAFLANTGEGPFLRTGDLGFLHNGELYVAGRLKEIIIIRGRNLSPQDVEQTVGRSHPALQPGAGAAFSIEVGDEERLVVVQELADFEHELTDVIPAIRRAVAEHHEIQPYAVALVKPGGVPKTPSGKIQRHPCKQAYLAGRLAVVQRSVLSGAAPVMDASPPTDSGTSPEMTLSAIWREILRVPEIQSHDNFFALGGDSLLSMQMIARARQAGLEVTIDQLLHAPTIAGLAELAQPVAPPSMNQERVVGAAPLTPRQIRYFERIHPDEYHVGEQVARMSTRVALNPVWLEAATAHLLEHHDALRMRFWQEGSEWRQFNRAAEDQPVFSYLDATDVPAEEYRKTVSNAAYRLKYGLNLQTGPLMRIELIHFGGDTPDMVLVTWNHLIFDAFSMRIMMEDLTLAYHQLSRGEQPQLLPKGTSYKEWGERLAAFAGSPECIQEAEYWMTEARTQTPCLPVDSAGSGYGGSVVGSLTTEETEILLRDVSNEFGTEINDVLLTALMQSLAPWTGSRSLLVELVGHGRSPIFPNVDLSRTVGYLANHFPVLLDLSDATGLEEEVRMVREQLREVPKGGVGYGVLRYLVRDPEMTERMSNLPEPQVMFKYDGQFDQTFSEDSLFENPFASIPYMVNPHDVGAKLVMFNPSVTQGQLHVVVRSGIYVHERTTMQQLLDNYLEALRAIIARVQSGSVVA